MWHSAIDSEKIVFIDVLQSAAPGRGIGVGDEAGVLGGELLGEPLRPEPDGEVVPEEPVFFVRDGADPLGDPLLHLGQEHLVVIDGLLRPPEGDDQGEVEEGVEGGQRRGPVHRRIEDRLPEPLPLDGEPPHLLDPVVIELLSADVLQKGDVFVDLPLDVALRLRGKSRVAEGGVEDEERNLEIPGLHLVPFEDRPADVVAADEHVGPGEAADRSAVDRRAGDIRAGIGAQVARIAHRLGLLAEIHPHLARPDHRPVVLRIDGDDVHRDQGLHRTAARDPGDLLPRLLRGLRLDIVGRHDLLHPRDRLDLPLFLRLVFFRHCLLPYHCMQISRWNASLRDFQIISTNASNRVRSWPSAGSRSSTSMTMLGDPLPGPGPP